MTSTTPPARIDAPIWRHARRRPDAVAVIHDGVPYTYRQLTEHADQVAEHLVQLGVGTDQVVGVSYPRTFTGLVHLLGVLRAGGALLYLDPQWPPQRLAFMTNRCDVSIVLSDTDGVRHLGPTAARPVEHEHPLCYVVFTSGTTGTPKGVQIEHPGVLNMASALAQRFGVREGTRVLQFAAWSWDAALCEIFMTLAAGGTLVLAPPPARAGGSALADLLRRHAVEVVTLTPSVLDAVPVADLPTLRTVVSVGEPCHPGLVARWTSTPRRVFNGYGPTEATVAVTVAACHPGADIHLGEPLPNVQVRIADSHDRDVSVGAVGELLVGGIGVARGYVHEPAMTAAKFTTDDAGDRWYRTGDLVAREADGALQYVGRLDDQVKVRGHRVTLGEIERVLCTHPAVRSAAVVVVADRIVAYVVVDASAIDAVIAYARTWLPDFMVPSEVRPVATLPLTSSGKRDHATVAQWATTTPAGASAHSTLARVTQIVERVLHAPASLDADTNVFDVGGHSLLAAELSVTLGEEFAVEVTFSDVILHPTPAQLAEVIDGRRTHLRAAGGAS